MEFGPALSLGVPSLAELMDVALGERLDAAALRQRLNEVSPDGLTVTGVAALDAAVPRLSRAIDAFDLLVRPAPDGLAYDRARLERIAARLADAPRCEVDRRGSTLDIRGYLGAADVIDGDAARRLCAALDWPASEALLRVRVAVTPTGSAKPAEVARVLGVFGAADPRAPRALLARLGVTGADERGEALDPLVAAARVTTLSASTSAEVRTR
jgi:hypothetical protein